MRLNIDMDSTDVRNIYALSRGLHKGSLGADEMAQFWGRNGNFLVSCFTRIWSRDRHLNLYTLSSDLIALALVNSRVEPGIAMLWLAAS
jgi:hypothetical protein